jgi:phytoene desaturase
VKVVVIGAGLAGLAAACHLTGDGHQVTLVERESHPGGRAGTLTQAGFRFDTGPTVFTMPQLLDDALAAVGASVDSHVPLRRLDPAYRARFTDGSTIDVRAGMAAMRDEIARTCSQRDADAFDGFVRWLEELNDIEVPHFIDRNYNSPFDLVARPAVAARLLRLGAFGRLGPAVKSRFADPRLHRLFSFQAMYAGLAPERALAVYALITYMDSIAGVYAPEGGMHAVPVAMADAVAAAGAEVQFGRTVTRVLRMPNGQVGGIECEDGDRVMADAVVCTLDPPVARRTVFADLGLPGPRRRARYSPSAVVWHLGVRGTVADDVSHHNIHFGEAWESAFVELLDKGRLMSDPSRMVCVPSLDDPGSAPPGHTTLYVLEPVPNLAAGRINWEAERPRMRERLLGFLDAEGYPTDIVTEAMDTPTDWLARGMAAGSPFALAHTFAQTGPFRTGNVVRQVPGLFLAGSGTVPGVGIPMVLISGRLAAERVAAYAA